ncbi:MAG: PAS domain S-box protein [Bacteroidetes bacterium]|nr:PAS domain S-box protein [Bacteroidota bacterium]
MRKKSKSEDQNFESLKIANEALRRSESLYHGLVETSQDLIWQCDVEGRYTYLNPEWERVFGFKTSEMLGRKFSDFQTPEQAKQDLIEFARILTGGSVKGYETIHIGKAGNEINLVFNSVHILNEAGSIIGTQGTAYDVTEQKEVERHIQHLASFPKYNPEPIIELDLKGKVKYYNPAVIAVLEDLKLDDPEVFLPVDINEIIERLDKKTGNPLISEISIKDRIYVQNICFVPGLDTVRIFCINITESKRFYEEQRAKGELLRIINTTTTKPELIQSVTSFLKQWLKCDAIGIRLKEGDDYPYFETLGFSNKFVKAEKYLCSYDKEGELIRDDIGNPVLDCMCGNILCERFDPSKSFFTERGSFWSNNTSDLLASTSDEDRQARTRNRCNGEGYESVGLFPLRFMAETFGLLQVNHKQPDLFTPGIISFLEHFSDNLAIALSSHNTFEMLRSSEEKYRALFENASETISIVQDGLIKFTNPNFYTMTGYSLEEMSAQNQFDVIYPEDRRMILDIIEARKRGEDVPKKYILRIIHKNNSIKWLARNTADVQWEGRPATLVIDNDITEMKSSEEKLQTAYKSLYKSEVRFKTLSDFSPLAIYETDKDGNCIYVNNKWCELTGLSQEEAEGFGWVNGLHPDDREYIQKLWYENAKSNAPWYFEYRFMTPEEKVTWVLGSAVALRDSSNNITGYIGANLDITERKLAEEALSLSQIKLTKAQLYAHVGSWTWDIKANRLEWSDEMFNIFGVDKGNFTGSLTDVIDKAIHPDDRARVDDSNLSIIQNKKPIPLEYRIIHPDRSIRWVWAEAGELILNDRGEPGILSGTVQDITERKQMEEELKRLHEFEKTKNEELVNKNNELKEARNATLNIIDDLVAQNEELEQAEELLRRSELKFRTVADFTYDWEYWEDEKDQIVYMSPSCERMTGYSPYELSTNPGLLTEMIYAVDKAIYNNHKHKIFSLDGKESIEELEFRIISKDSSIVYIQHICRPIFDENNKYLGRRISNRDITERKKAEEEIRKYQEHLEELVKTRTEELEFINSQLRNEIVKEKEVESMLKESLDKEKELGELKTQFVSTVSHEFRTPLTTILSSIELLQKYGRKWDEIKYLKHTEKVIHSIDHLTSLLENVLLLNKTDSGKVEFNPQTVRFDIFCTGIISEIKPMITDHHKLLFDYKAKDTEILIDEKLMRMILLNLLSNAIKYSPAGGSIKLLVTQEVKIKITVSDEGMGIETKDQDKVFDSFYRTEDASDLAGTGLGLAIVKRSVALHQGEIWLKSEKDKGTAFFVEIPLIKV